MASHEHGMYFRDVAAGQRHHVGRLCLPVAEQRPTRVRQLENLTGAAESRGPLRECVWYSPPARQFLRSLRIIETLRTEQLASYRKRFQKVLRPNW